MVTYDLDIPILFVHTNSMYYTVSILEKIQTVKPQRLYIAGYTTDNLDDIDNNFNVREILTDINWDCDVKTFYLPYNPNVKDITEQAISWFFDYEPEGIIIEGYCLPSLSFFGFCSQLLEKYRYDDRISIISGGNYNNKIQNGEASYYFSSLIETSGFACWKRSWQDYLNYSDLITDNNLDIIEKSFVYNVLKTQWNNIIVKSKNNIFWNDKFSIINIRNQKLSIIPYHNLTEDIYNKIDNSPIIEELNELIHPELIICDTLADVKSQEIKFEIPIITNNIPDGFNFLKDKLLSFNDVSLPLSERILIPKIIHQIYEDPIGPSDGLIELAKSWQEKNPSWEYRFWNKKAMEDFIEEYCPEFMSIYRSYPFSVQRWDAIRYLILYHIGGLYVDFDYECLESIDVLMCDSTCIMGMEPTLNALKNNKQLIIGNAFMASVPKHQYVKEIINDLHQNHGKSWSSNRGTQILETTGPFLTTRVYENLIDKKMVTLLSADLIAPLTLKEVRQLYDEEMLPHIERKIDNAFAIHYFCGSWVEQLYQIKASNQIKL